MSKRFGPFLTDSLLSSGGMSTVYSAVIWDGEHPCGGRQRAAVKVANIASKTDPEHVRFFQMVLQEEARLLQVLKHPSIVRIFPPSMNGKVPDDSWFGRDEDPPHPYYYGMELLEGDSLMSLIYSPDYRNFGHSWRVELLYQIAMAVDYLHIRGVVHHDLTPSNILFRKPPRPDEVPQPVLIDFGLAQTRKARHMLDLRAATLEYASPAWIVSMQEGEVNSTGIKLPNRFASKSTLFPYDIWSLGLIAFEMFNEKYAFGTHKQPEDQLINRILDGRFEPLKPGLPQPIARIIRNMVDRHDDKRLTIEEVLHDLETVSDCISPRM